MAICGQQSGEPSHGGNDPRISNAEHTPLTPSRMDSLNFQLRLQPSRGTLANTTNCYAAAIRLRATPEPGEITGRTTCHRTDHLNKIIPVANHGRRQWQTKWD